MRRSPGTERLPGSCDTSTCYPVFLSRSVNGKEKDAVRILTVHKSKGKEYPVVFVVDLVKDKFPLRYQSKPFYVPNDLAKGLKTGDDEKALFLQEERRLCYVAMTRAQEKLYLTLAKRYGERKTDAKPSQFLFELGYPDNPLMDRTTVSLSAEEEAGPAGQSGRYSSNDRSGTRHIRAVEQMHLKTAIQRIVELEKIRLLEAGKITGYRSTRLHSSRYRTATDALRGSL